jgi:tRNA threonylcarbamoyladenosine biosynthesis protein TsaB
MRILAIETTGREGTVAILEGCQAEATLVAADFLRGGRTAQTLAPAIQSLLAAAGWPAASVELVSVAIGPGSFTGLRIGVTTAKTLTYAIGAQIVGVDTMDALAAQAPPDPAPLWTIMDAQRQELFVARFPTTADSSLQRDETRIISQEAWLAQIQHGDRVTGPSLVRLKQRLPNGAILLPEELWQPTATSVGRVAWHRFQSGLRDDVWKLAPKYLRLSAAEEKKVIPNSE